VNILDRLFQILFARYRRKLGDSNLEASWYRASNDLGMNIGSPILALEFAVFVLLYVPLIKGSALDSRSSILMTGAAVFFACAYLFGLVCVLAFALHKAGFPAIP